MLVRQFLYHLDKSSSLLICFLPELTRICFYWPKSIVSVVIAQLVSVVKKLSDWLVGLVLFDLVQVICSDWNGDQPSTRAQNGSCEQNMSGVINRTCRSGRESPKDMLVIGLKKNWEVCEIGKRRERAEYLGRDGVRSRWTRIISDNNSKAAGCNLRFAECFRPSL